MFDAGAIQAHLDVDLGTFNRKMDEAEARVKRFEAEKHEVKLSAVFDTASMGRARQMFTQLDQQLSRDAMQRLRSSPQGSILGSLNALLSPHGVTGAPSVSQIAGGSNVVSRAVSGGGGGPSLGSVLIRQATVSGGGDSGVIGALAAATATKTAADALKVAADDTSKAADDTSKAADDTSKASRNLFSGIRDLFGRAGFGGGRGTGLVSAVSTAGDPNQSAIAKLLGAAGPGIGKLGTKPALITGGVGALLAGVPALLGGLAPLIPGAIGAGVIGLGAKELIGTQQKPGQLYGAAQTLDKSVTPMLQAGMAPLAAGLTQAFAQIPKLLAGLLPTIKQFFGAASTLIQPLLLGLTDLARTILPLLAQGFKLAAPFIRPLVDAIGSLAGGLLQGLNTLLKAAAPAVAAVVSVLKGLGTNLGAFFADMAPALAASGIVLKALFDIIGGLLPVIAKLAGVFAQALAPVIVSFGQAIKALEPALVIIGKVIGDLAAAVLGDLASALTAIAQLIVGMAPAFTVLAKVMGQVFNALESAGVFGALSSALEQLAGPLAKLIDLIIIQLVPILPILVTLLTKVVSIMITLAAAGLGTVLSLITQLLVHMPFLVPLLGAIAAAWAVWSVVMSLSPIGAIIVAIVGLIGAITLLATHWHQVWTDIKNWAMDAWNFLTHGWGQWLLPGLTAIRMAVQFVRDHWHQAWDDMKNWAEDFWNWLDQVFGHDIGGFFTQTLPGWFDTAVNGIKGFWDKVQQVVEDPVKFVIDHVLDGLISVFDDITNAVGLGKPIGQVHPMGLAAGGRIPGFGGGDRWPALLEGGEAVVPKHLAMTAEFASWAMAHGIPGYAAGAAPKTGQNAPGGGSLLGHLWHGVTSTVSGIAHKALDLGKMAIAVATGNATALTNAFSDLLGLKSGATPGHMLANILVNMPKQIVKDLVSWLIGHGGTATGSGADIANYAMTFLGKIPYVWGGTAVPGGADCSGFVEAIYKHFGINAPRTSEAQGSWVTRSGPQAGGLAFYHSPAGGPDPGHVAIVRSAQQVISQGGGMGPTLMAINAMPLLWTGVPPGGFGKGGGGGATPGSMTAAAISQLWTSLGGPAYAAANMAQIAYAESGDVPGTIQQGQPPGLTGWGLYQITPTSGIMQNGAFGNLLNAANNTRAAISLFSASGYSPWASDPVGRQLSAAPFGYAQGGLIQEPVIGFGTLSGRQYQIGENGPEFVTPVGKGGSAIGNVFITLPEGQTVAKALSDLTFWLRVAQQQNYVGVMPGG